MRTWQFDKFGLDELALVDREAPQPGPGEAVLGVQALSLNYRDLMIVTGGYNPRMKLPAVPLSDAAGVVTATGDGVTRVKEGDRVMTQFVSGWLDGPYRAEYGKTTLGTPAPGVAAEQVALPAEALVPMPDGWDFAAAATLPIAGLTAWSALVTEGGVGAGDTVLTLGTGGVSVFVVQLGAAIGARVIVTSSSDDKLERARALGAADTVNYRTEPAWHERVLVLTERRGVDLVVENGGIGTLTQSLAAVRAGGTVALLGALTGLAGELNIAPIMMRRLRLCGILVDSRAAFEAMVAFLADHRVEPVIDARFRFDELGDALRHLQSGAHFGKIVVELA